MVDFFDQALEAIDDDPFEEKIVSLEEFVRSKDYLGLPPLSDIQYNCIKKMSTILQEETYQYLRGEEAGSVYFKKNRAEEVILVMGKGSGKDYSTTIAVAYIVYQLLCLKDPQAYYGKPPGDPIHIMNIAINAKQANQVFFKGFMQRIKHSPWFDGRYNPRSGEVDFDKEITVVSGHSEAESLEGYNVLVVVLDEISGFKMDSTSSNPMAITAQSTYDMHKAAVTSRFPENGCLVMLSFPRSLNDFILQQYNDVIAEKEEIPCTHTFKKNDELPDGIEENEFTLEWTEDEILQYTYSSVFALKAPSWKVNPTKNIENYKMDFLRSPRSARTRFLCDPSETDESLFHDYDKIEAAMTLKNGIDEEGRMFDNLRPVSDETDYYMHIDLAQKRDRAVASLCHVEEWVQYSEDGDVVPKIIVDAVRWWTPTKEKTIDYKWIRQYVMDLRRRGFRIHTVTFDRWGSVDMIDYMERNGMKSGILSVALTHFEEFALLIYDGRVKMPYIKILKDELEGLKVIKGKVVGSGSQYQVDDLAYATAGAVYNAVSLAEPEKEGEIEVISYTDVVKKEADDRIKAHNLIEPPKQRVTPEVYDWLDSMNLI